MRFCNSLYAKNRIAFSAMAPTIGAGKPYQPEDKVGIVPNGKKKRADIHDISHAHPHF